MEHELLTRERQFWQAGGDGEFYRRHFADDGQCVFAFGVLDKAATVASMESSQPWSSFEFDDVTIIELTSEAAAVTYAAQATRGDDAYEAMVSSVYARRDGQWQLVLHHQTPRA